MNQGVSNQKTVFIQQRAGPGKGMQQLNNYMEDKDSPMNIQNHEEQEDGNNNFVHPIRQFPQPQSQFMDGGGVERNQRQDSEYNEVISVKEEDNIRRLRKEMQLQQFREKNLSKQPINFTKEELNKDKEDKDGEEDVVSNEVNLKYGDIIYFKFYKEQSKGIVSGDGIAGNKLECISIGKVIQSGSEEHFNYEQDESEYENDDEVDERQAYANPIDDPNKKKQILNKRASLQFRKCLFRVVNSKKYYYYNQYHLELKNIKTGTYKSKNQQQKLSDIESKMKEEQEENKRVYEHKIGTNVIYGQEIQLEHIYSKCVVTLNPDVLAYEHCCRELSLEEFPSQWSNFIINSSNNAKKTGEPVMYKEQISIYSSENPYYWINIQQPQTINEDDQESITHLFDEGLEVNCTDRQVPLKLNLYLGVDEQNEREDNESKTENKPVSIGDVVYIYNRIVKGRIGVQRKTLSKSSDTQFSMKEVEVLIESLQEQQPKQVVPIKVLKIEDYTKNISQQYELFIDTDEEENRIETLWEIQREKNFNSSLAIYDENIRIRNVWTGLYLILSENDEISLTLEGSLDKSFFQIKPKRVVQEVLNMMLYQQPVKIYQKFANKTMFLRVKEDPYDEDEFNSKFFMSKRFKMAKFNFTRVDCKDLEESDKPKLVNSISLINVKKDKRGEIEFELVKADTKLINLADRVSSLYPYLMNFYVFLLQWGNDIYKRPNKTEQWSYEYSLAFEQQKYLYNYVQQLYQSIENLYDFLKQDAGILQRQKILLDAGIVEILILTLKLIHHKIYSHNEIDKGNQNKDAKNVNDKQNNIKEKTPQRIASLKLSKTIGVLYDVLIKCIQGNSECSSFVLKMQKDNFLFDQIRYHKQEVVQLLKEATRYTDGEQKEQNIENMKNWISKLRQISTTNIQEQTFIIELLCLSITDHLEQPIIEYQNALRKIIFNQPGFRRRGEELENNKKNAQGDKKYQGLLRKPCLISFKIEFDQPYIIFNAYDKGRFEKDNQFLYYTGKKPSVRDDANINHFPYDHINGAKAKGKSSDEGWKNLENYENYVFETLNLYSLLSAGRNNKSIKCLASIGLTKDYIFKCLKQKIDNNQLRQYRSILNLYDSFILNIPPFIPISGYQNLVFLNQDFQEFDTKKQPSYVLFREIVVNQETKNEIKEEYSKLTEKTNSSKQEVNEAHLLQQYSSLIVNREEEQYKEDQKFPDRQQQISSLQIQEQLTVSGKLDGEKIIDKLNHEKADKSADKGKLSKFMMEAFHQMLKITKTRINLGYNTPEQNMKVLNIIPNLFVALINYKDQQREQNANDLTEQTINSIKQEKLKDISQRYNKNWIYNFMRYNLEYSYDDLITTKIFIEAISIVNIIDKINMYLFIVEVIQKKRPRQLAEGVDFEVTPDDCLNFFQQFKFTTETDKKRVNLNVLIMQTMEYLRKDPILEQTMFKTLLKNFDYMKDLQNQTFEVEIIEDAQEIEIYKDVNGITENNQNTRSPQDIKQMVFKTLQYFSMIAAGENEIQVNYETLEEEQKQAQDLKQAKLTDLSNNFNQLKIAIKECNTLFDKKASEHSANKNHYRTQLQNIFRHSRIPEYLLDLLKNVPENSDFLDFYRSLMDFFYYYVKDNMTNKRRILDHITPIMKICFMPNEKQKKTPNGNDYLNNTSYEPIKITKLCTVLLEDIKTDPSMIRDIINQIINLIEEHIPFITDGEKVKGEVWKAMNYKMQKYEVDELKCLALIQYFKILKSLTVADTGNSIKENQLQILNNFMHKKTLSDMVYPYMESQLTKSEVRFETQNEYLKLKLHAQGIILLSQCCKDFKIGIQEIQRFVMFDTLKAIVISQYAPFILKRAYLKCLFEAYVNKVYDLEKDSSNETISNIELNDILHSEVIPNLAITTSYRYIQGIVVIKGGKREESSIGMRETVKRRKYNLFEPYKADYDKALWADDDNMLEQGIVKDDSEYWKYLFKEGIINFVIDSFDEFTDIIGGDSKENDYQGSIYSNFQIIGNYLVKLQEQIELVEKEFKIISIQQKSYINFDLLNNGIDVVPIGQPKKSGTHFIISNHGNMPTKMIKMNMPNGDQQQSDAKQDLALIAQLSGNEGLILELIEVQRQFRLTLLRKRMSIKEFLSQFYHDFQEHKSISKALFFSLNIQKIIYTPTQINYILKKFCDYDEKSVFKSQGSLKQRKSSSSVQDVEDQISSVMTKIYTLATKNYRTESLQENNNDSNILNDIMKTHKSHRSQQARIDTTKIQFGRIIRKQIKNRLNILKKSILDKDVEKEFTIAGKNKKNLQIVIQKYNKEIDNCIGDYEEYSKLYEEDNQAEIAKISRAKTFAAMKKTKTITQKQIEQNIPGSLVDEGLKEIEEPQEESEIGRTEEIFINRMMIDSQIALFLRDIQAELNIYSVSNENDEGEDDNDEAGEDMDDEEDNPESYSYQANQEINPQRRVFQSYLELFAEVFSGQKYYLVKIVRLLLETVQIDDQTMSKLTSTHNRERKRSQAKFDLLQLCQDEVANLNIFVHALKFLKVDSTYDEVQEGLTFMICMLNRGNLTAQNALLTYLKNDTDALVDFFSFLRNFFNQEISQQIKGMYDQQHVSNVPTEFEILSLKILRLIQLLCENVNSDFQLFLMKQSDDEKSFLSNYNVTLEVSTFLSIFLEDDLLQMQRKQNIIIQCIDTLNECISGQQQVLECIARNKRLFIYLNEKILRQNNLNFRPYYIKRPKLEDLEKLSQESERKRKRLELFQSGMKLILTIVSGINICDDLEFLLDQAHTNKLIVILHEIYNHRIRPKEDEIQMGQHCKHQTGITDSKDTLICSDDYCIEGNVTPLDELIISIGFNIFIFFYYIRDVFPSYKEKLLAFHLDEKKDLEITLDLTDFGIDMNNKPKVQKLDESQIAEKQEKQARQSMKKKTTLKMQYQQSSQIHNHNNADDEEEESENGNQGEQDGEGEGDENEKKTEDQNNFNDEVNERMSARKLFYRGKTQVILKDLAQFDQGVVTEEKQVIGGEQDGFNSLSQEEYENMCENEQWLSDKNKAYFKFFKSFIGSVEVVDSSESIKKVYFQKPFYTKYLTPDIKKHLIYEADRDSDQERLMFLIDHQTFYEDQMIHKQSISKWGIFSYVADKWRLYKQLSYYLVVALTIITLATYGQNSENGNNDVANSTSNENIKNTFLVVSYIQLLLSFAILVSCAIERFPISVFRNVQSQVYDTIQKHKKNAGFPDDSIRSLYNLVANKLYNIFSRKNAKSKKYVKFILVCTDQENVYNLIYLIITGFAFSNNLIYSFLLLDIVKRSEDLQNVISSFTKNAQGLFKFTFLGIVIMYIYGIIGFQQFKGDYDSTAGAISDSFILTITTTIKEGLRNGGGLADSLTAIQYNDTHFWGRYFFDLTFFIIINMLFIQMIFGIILDTFGELRDNRQELLSLVKETCYICGYNRRYIEANSDEDWYHHIYMEHNCYNLLFYMIYIKRKSENDCDALEKYIKKCLNKSEDKEKTLKPIDFIPIQKSLSIQMFRNKEKEPGHLDEESETEIEKAD